MAEGQELNPDAPVLSLEEKAKRLGIELPGDEDTEAAASPGAEEARQDDSGPSEEASRAKPAPEPEAKETSEVGRQEDRLRELEERLQQVQRDYGESSKEAKRLAERVKQADGRLAALKEKYSLEELEDWKPEQAEEDRPITMRDIQMLEEQRKWRTAEETFFGSEKNADLAGPALKKWVKSLLFTDDGLLAYPNKTPRESFEAAAKEARKILDSQRLQGRQERDKVRDDIKRAAVAEGTGKPPEKPKEKPAEDAPDENEYVKTWRKFKEKRGL